MIVAWSVPILALLIAAGWFLGSLLPPEHAMELGRLVLWLGVGGALALTWQLRAPLPPQTLPGGRDPWRWPAWIWATAALTWMTLSVSWSPLPHAAWWWLPERWAALAIALWLFLRPCSDGVRILTGAGCCGIMLVGIDLGAQLLGANTEVGSFSLLGQINWSAGVAIAPIGGLAAWLILQARDWRRNLWLLIPTIVSCLALIVIGTGWISGDATRAIWPTLFAMTCTLVAVRFLPTPLALGLLALGFVTLGIGVGGTAAGWFDDALHGHSLVQRKYLWLGAWQAFAEQPLIGHGSGSGLAVYQQQEAHIGAWLTIPETFTEHAHNSPLHQLAEIGLVGVSLLSMALVATIRPLWQRRRTPLAAALLVAWSGAIAHTFYASHMSQPAAWFALALLAAASWRYCTETPPATATPPNTKHPATRALLASGALAVAAILTVRGITSWIPDAGVGNANEWYFRHVRSVERLQKQRQQDQPGSYEEHLLALHRQAEPFIGPALHTNTGLARIHGAALWRHDRSSIPSWFIEHLAALPTDSWYLDKIALLADQEEKAGRIKTAERLRRTEHAIYRRLRPWLNEDLIPNNMRDEDRRDTWDPLVELARGRDPQFPVGTTEESP